jgi:hypothetical protein
MNQKNIKPEPFKTILVITMGMLTIYIITKWNWALSLSLTIGLLGLFFNYLAIKIDFLWMKLAWVLSLIVPNILLSIIFYLFLMPIAFLSKIFEKNQLNLKNNSKSLFKSYNKKFDKLSFEKPW